jgi:ectoine hydroxylase-related dioxygenase (phytanoyl-CoA dioxygenase family)
MGRWSQPVELGTMMTAEHAQRYLDEGYVVVDDVIGPSDLAILRSECRRLVQERDNEMSRLGVDSLDLCHRGRRYFLHAYESSPAVRAFLLSNPLASIARNALGDTVYLFNEQFVVKAAEQGMGFGWHQDSGYIPYEHLPYLTCWIPLDDVDESNGTVYLLPFSRADTRTVAEHHRDDSSNDSVGYFGDDPGDPVVAKAGSVVAFSSTLFHRSGPNLSGRPRRVFIAQYSAEPIFDEDGKAPRHLAEPL